MEPRKRILVVDDDADACELIATILRSVGFEVEMACDGFEALTRVGESPIDLVLTDMQMPGMNGVELIRNLRKTHVSAPAILMTGAETWDLCTKAEAYGAVECLTKPINLDELVWLIERALACEPQSAAAFGNAAEA